MWEFDGQNISSDDKKRLKKEKEHATCPFCHIKMTYKLEGHEYLMIEKWDCKEGHFFKVVTV